MTKQLLPPQTKPLQYPSEQTSIALPATGSTISVDDLWKIYGPNPTRALQEYRAGSTFVQGHMAAVHGVSFQIRPSETFVVMGLSGSGKSTLIRCLTRLIEPTAGIVDIDGNNVLKLPDSHLAAQRRKDWAMVFQHFGLLPHRRVLQNVAFGLEIAGVSRSEREERAHRMIELVGLSGTENKYPSDLSGGMRQRVGLARALVQNPRLLLLDEPFSALDPLIRAELQDEMLRLASSGSQTSIFITHDLAEALKVGDRIAIMRDGVLVQVGTPEEIVLNPVDSYVRRFAVEAPRAKVVRAATLAQPLTEISAGLSVEEALEHFARSDVDAALVVPDARRPFVVTVQALLKLHSTSQTIGSLGLKTDIVPESELLATVMASLVETGHPVLVEDSKGGFVGAIDHFQAMRALSVPVAM